MKKSYAELMMNPVKLRIMGQVAQRGEIGAKELKEILSDVPLSSIYRHLNEWEEAGILCVAQETKIRGTIKKTYAIRKEFTQENVSGEQLEQMVHTGLSIIGTEFYQYFSGEDIDVERDCIDFSSMVFWLSKEEYADIRKELAELVKRYSKNKKTEERMARRVTFLSSPVTDEGKR